MWTFLDHLNASIAVPVVAGIAIAAALALQADRVEGATRLASSGRLYQTVDWIERDLDNLGSGRAGGPTLLDYSWTDSLGTVSFVTAADTSVTAATATVRYRRVQDENGLYTLRRYAVGPAGTSETASTDAVLAVAEIAVLDAGGAAVHPDSLAAARSILVHLAIGAPSDRGVPVDWRQRFYLP